MTRPSGLGRIARIAAVAVLLAMIAVVSACGPGADRQPTAQTTTQTGPPVRPSDLDPSEMAELTSLQCSDDINPSLAVPEVDVSQFRWDLPAGFRRSYSYYQEDPVEGRYVSDVFLVPIDQKHNLDVIGIVLYPQLALGDLVSACQQLDEAAALKRIDQYHSILGAHRLEGPELVTVGGLPTYEEILDVDPRGYTWRSYWIFGDNQLFHVSCQWVVDEATIERGCADLISSIRFE